MCDTHTAIKCNCTGNKAAVEQKIKQLTDKAASDAEASQVKRMATPLKQRLCR
jgi:hypothetical protein